MDPTRDPACIPMHTERRPTEEVGERKRGVKVGDELNRCVPEKKV